MTRTQATSQQTETKTEATRQPRRASLAIRITLIVLAVAALIGAGIIGANISAINTYNQATQNLRRNLHEANGTSPDLDRLTAQMQQTDAQFEDASRLGPLLLPQVKNSIKHNTTVSQQLTGTTHRKLVKAKREAAREDANGNASGQSTDVNGGQNQDSALTDEQRRQIEQMLKDNQPATGQGGDQTKRPPADQQSKPW